MLQVGEPQNSGTIWPILHSAARQEVVEHWLSELEKYRLHGGSEG